MTKIQEINVKNTTIRTMKVGEGGVSQSEGNGSFFAVVFLFIGAQSLQAGRLTLPGVAKAEQKANLFAFPKCSNVDEISQRNVVVRQ